jgi:hypothetical protein
VTPADLVPWLVLAREHGVRMFEFDAIIGGDGKAYHFVKRLELAPAPPPTVTLQPTDMDLLFAATEGLPDESEMLERMKPRRPDGSDR